MARKEILEAKLETYERVLAWSESSIVTKEDILWYLKKKITSHEKLIKQYTLREKLTNIFRTLSRRKKLESTGSSKS